MSNVESCGQTADVVLVAVMFVAYFVGLTFLAHVAIAAFFALSTLMLVKLYGKKDEA